MDWSNNPIKLARAKGNLGASATEEQLKADYIRLGGAIVGAQPIVTVPPVTEKEVTMKVVEKKKAVKKVTKKVAKVVKKK